MKQLEFNGSPLYLVEIKGQLGFINSQLTAALRIHSEGIAGFMRSNKRKFISGIDYSVLNAEEVIELKEYLNQNNLSIGSKATLFIVFLEGLKKYYRLMPGKIDNEFISLLIDNGVLTNEGIQEGETNNLDVITTTQLKLAEAMLEILEELDLPTILKFKYMSNILAGKQLDDDTYNKILSWLGEE